MVLGTGTQAYWWISPSKGTACSHLNVYFHRVGSQHSKQRNGRQGNIFKISQISYFPIIQGMQNRWNFDNRCYVFPENKTWRTGVADQESNKAAQITKRVKANWPKKQRWNWSQGGTKWMETWQRKEISNTINSAFFLLFQRTQKANWWCRLPQDTQPTEQGVCNPIIKPPSWLMAVSCRRSSGAPDTFWLPVTWILRNPCSHQDLGNLWSVHNNGNMYNFLISSFLFGRFNLEISAHSIPVSSCPHLGAFLLLFFFLNCSLSRRPWCSYQVGNDVHTRVCPEVCADTAS